VNAANEIVAIDETIGHERAPMETAAIEHRCNVIDPHNHQIDFADQRILGFPIFQFIDFRN
jgi:hypothetical protein